MLFAPPGTTLGDESLAEVVVPLEAAGWRLLVERRHYEFEPPPELGRDVPTDLSWEQVSDPDDPRLVAFVDLIARLNGGRVFAPSPDRLGDYVVSDYLRARRGRRAG